MFLIIEMRVLFISAIAVFKTWLASSLVIKHQDVLFNATNIFPFGPFLASNTSKAGSEIPRSGLNQSMLEADVYMIDCFLPTRTPINPSYAPVVMEDYYKVIQQILTQSHALFPHNYVLDNRPDYTVQWHSNQCGIYLGALEWATYTIAPVEVARAAALIADDCLTEETNFMGGTARVSVPQGTVLVAVASRVYRLGKNGLDSLSWAEV